MPVLTITTGQIPWLIVTALALLALGVVIGLLSGDAARTRRLRAAPTPEPALARPERHPAGRHARPHGLHRHHGTGDTGGQA